MSRIQLALNVSDLEQAIGFYSKLFGWNMSTAGPASMIDTRADAGIDGHITALGHEPHHYTLHPGVRLDRALEVADRLCQTVFVRTLQKEYRPCK